MATSNQAKVAAWVLGSVLMIFLMLVLFVLPELSSSQTWILKFLMALLAAFFAYFFSGEVGLKGKIHGNQVAAGGGFALFILIFFYGNPSDLRAVAGDHLPDAVRHDARLKDAQENLVILGLLQKPADGIRDSETTLALRSFQKENGLTANGVLTIETVAVLRAMAAKVVKPRDPQPPVKPDPGKERVSSSQDSSEIEAILSR